MAANGFFWGEEDEPSYLQLCSLQNHKLNPTYYGKEIQTGKMSSLWKSPAQTGSHKDRTTRTHKMKSKALPDIWSNLPSLHLLILTPLLPLCVMQCCYSTVWCIILNIARYRSRESAAKLDVIKKQTTLRRLSQNTSIFCVLTTKQQLCLGLHD